MPIRTAALLLVLLPACQTTEPARVHAPADSSAGELAFELAGPGGAALVVPVSINGAGPFDFVLDTGATLTCLDQSLADSLDLPPVRGALGVGAGVGGSGQMRLVRVDSIAVGNASVAGAPACVIDLSHAEAVGLQAKGLLGLNFLKSYRVTIDFERSVLRLQAR